MNCGLTWNLAIADNCANSWPCPSGLNTECPDGHTCFTGTPCPEPPPKQQSDEEDDGVDPNWASTETNMFCGDSWATTIAACKEAQPCPTGLSSDCPAGQTCFVDTPCGPPSPKPEADPSDQAEYCAETFSWLTNMNDCAETSGCPSEIERGGCPLGTRCVGCRGQPDSFIDVPTLEVRCVPNSLHTSAEGCSVRCCVTDQ